MSVTVRWVAFLEDDEYDEGTEEQETILLGDWADCEGNADSAVKKIVEHFFDHATWGEWFGHDDRYGAVRVHVSQPAAIAGEYTVHLERVTSGQVRKAKSP